MSSSYERVSIIMSHLNIRLRQVYLFIYFLYNFLFKTHTFFMNID